MLPGGTPYKELAVSLSAIAVGDATGIAAGARRRRGYRPRPQKVVPEDGQLLLVVDQFEELFTLSPEAERGRSSRRDARGDRPGQPAARGGHAAGRLLRPAAGGPAVRRARPGSDCDHRRDAPGRGRGGHGRARAAGRPHGRARPGRRAGRRSLAARARCAARAAVRALRAGGAERGRALSLAAYRAIGGIDGAIATRADELYLSLDDTDRRQVRELFERLVVVDTDGEPTRRRASREELTASAEVVDRWAAARLLTLDVHPQTRAPSVEVAHEALVREWPRLRQWIEDDRSELIVIGRLRDSAATWTELERESSALLRGTALEAALDVAGSRVPPLAPLEAEFLEASRAARDTEQAQQSELIRRQARTNRRLRLQLGASPWRWWWP